MTTQTNPIRLIKLVTGETLISEVQLNDDENYTTLIKPVCVNRHLEDGYESSSLSPWETLSVDNVFYFRSSDIMVIATPKENVVAYYTSYVNNVLEDLHEEYLNFEDEETVESIENKIKELEDKIDDELLETKDGEIVH